MTNNLYKRKLTAGFSLLEVLISVVVVAFGVLGMAALQLKTLQNSHSGLQRTLASVIALDAAERLWGNMAMNTPLTAAEIQALWLTHWRLTTDNRQTLPGLTGTIVAPTAPATNYTITVSWTENRFGNSDVASQFVYSIDLYP